MPYLSRRNKKHGKHRRTMKGGAAGLRGRGEALTPMRDDGGDMRLVRRRQKAAAARAARAAADQEAENVVVSGVETQQQRLDREQAEAYAKGAVISLDNSDDEPDGPSSPVSLSSSPSRQSSPDFWVSGEDVDGPGARPWADRVAAARKAESAAARGRALSNAAGVTGDIFNTAARGTGSVLGAVARGTGSVLGQGLVGTAQGLSSVLQGINRVRGNNALSAVQADTERRRRAMAAAQHENDLVAQQSLQQQRFLQQKKQLQKQRLLQQQQDLEHFYPNQHLPQQRGQVQYQHPPSYLSEAELAQARIDALMTGTPSPALLRLRQEQAKQAEIARVNDLMLSNPPITVAQPVTPEATVIGKNKDYSRTQDMQDEKALQKALRESQDIATAHRTQAMQDEQALQNAMRMSKVDAETNEKQRRDRENRQLRQVLEKSEMQQAMEQSIRQAAADEERIALNNAVLKSGEAAAVKAAENISALEEIARKTGQGLQAEPLDDDDEGYKTAPGSLSSSPGSLSPSSDDEEILLTPVSGGKKRRRKTRKYKKVKFIKKKRKHTHKRKLPKKSRKKRPRKFKKTLKH